MDDFDGFEEFYSWERCIFAPGTDSLGEGERWCNCDPATNTICWKEMGRQNAAACKLGWDMGVQAQLKFFLEKNRLVAISHPVLQQPVGPNEEHMEAMAELARTAARQQEEQGHINSATPYENDAANSTTDNPNPTQFDQVGDVEFKGMIDYDPVAPEDDLILWMATYQSEQGAPTTLAAEDHLVV
ncbi:hypothetical protein HBH96_120010 [Parastagonospora nodorum]|nr:hypothetical protein HBH96_120010 [Parastagonospora nodorum]KAH5693955.1 hypothetical protein HBI44_141270 [Parastagonospora nodorum]KAH6398682.1 hypothetical protein HBI60_099930 [Parastagonospora nodorum]